jgi:hypothetical protein
MFQDKNDSWVEVNGNRTYLPFRHPLDVVGRGDSREELRGLCMAH